MTAAITPMATTAGTASTITKSHVGTDPTNAIPTATPAPTRSADMAKRKPRMVLGWEDCLLVTNSLI
jgi:hypothetical protein